MDQKEHGVTLFELLLAIVIGSAIIYMGIRQYQSFRMGADARQLQDNVNVLFQAMSNFYKANAYGSFNPSNTTLTWAPLNLRNSSIPSNPYPVNIETQLQPYITQDIPFNPIVENTAAGQGYVAQFNGYTQSTEFCVTASASAPAWGPTTSMGCAQSGAKQTGTAVVWQIQISVLINNPALRAQYLALTGANCLSKLNSTQTSVAPCASASTNSGNYLVWERQATSPETDSSFWPINPMVSEFTKMYRQESITYSVGVPDTLSTTLSTLPSPKSNPVDKPDKLPRPQK